LLLIFSCHANTNLVASRRCLAAVAAKYSSTPWFFLNLSPQMPSEGKAKCAQD